MQDPEMCIVLQPWLTERTLIPVKLSQVHGEATVKGSRFWTSIPQQLRITQMMQGVCERSSPGGSLMKVIWVGKEKCVDFKELSLAKIQIHNFHMSIMYLVYPPQNVCISIVSNFFWDLHSSQENLKTILMQNFRGQTRCIMVHVKVVNNRNLCTILVNLQWSSLLLKLVNYMLKPTSHF